MTRQHLNLHDGDVAVLARALGTDGESLRDDLDRRPWYANDVLRRPEVIESVLHGAGVESVAVSPLLFFAVLTHSAAEELSSTDWVDEWAGPGCRLPVFDVEPLLEFADAPARLLFTRSTAGELRRARGFTDTGRSPRPRRARRLAGRSRAHRPHRVAASTRRPGVVPCRCVS